MDTQVQLYEQNDLNEEFPVLKAFQRYLNEEQNKARKRMVGLCIFFAVLMVLVVSVFMIMIYQVSARNQQLNDRLVEFAMRERQQMQQPPVIVQQPIQQPAETKANDAEIKALTEEMAKLQKQLLRQQKELSRRAKEDEERRRLEDERARAEAERQRAIDEKKRIAEEKERKRQEEIERHRRRLYPEYYARKDAEARGETLPPSTPSPAVEQPPVNPAPVVQPRPEEESISQEAIEDLLNEVDQILADEAESPDDEEDEDDVEAVTYFDDEEYEVPLKVNEKEAKWRVPLD